MKCNLLLSCLLVVAVTSFLFSQPCDPLNQTTFSTTYLGADAMLDYGIAAVQKATGEYAVLGLRQTAASSSDYQLYFSLIDADGDLISGTPKLISLKQPTSSAVLYSPSTVVGAKIIEVTAPAGGTAGYAFCALVKEASNQTSVVLGRLNSSGDMVWVKTFSQFDGVTDTPVGLFQEPSTSDLVLFVSRPLGHGTGYLSVLTVAFGGGSCSQSNYFVSDNQLPAFTPTAVARVNMTGSLVRYAVGGNLNSNPSILYLDQSLNPVTGVHCPSYNFDGNTTTFETISDLRQDGSQMVVAGRAVGSNANRLFLSKVTINSNAAPAWTRILEVSSLPSPTGLNVVPAALEVISGGGYVVGGTVNATGILPRAFLVRTDASGAPTWLRHYREANNTSLYDGLLASDGGFCFVGTQFSSTTASSQFAVKTDELGRLADCDCWDSTVVSSTQPTGTFVTANIIVKVSATCTPVEVNNVLQSSLPPGQVFCDKFSPGGDCVAAFTATVVGCGLVQFTNGSSAPGTPSWNWTFPGGTPSSSSLPNPSTTYPMGGNRIACLTVTSGALQCSVCDPFPVPCDTIEPLLTCPPNAQVVCGNPFDPAATGQPLFGDNCGPVGVTLAFSDVLMSGNTTCSGLIWRTWTATDVCGNQSSCIQNITIFDPQSPFAVCKNALVVSLDANCQATISPADVDGGSFDNCPVPLSFSLNQSTFDADDACKNIPVTLTVTDCAGNFNTCLSTVSVETDFTLTCPADITATGIDGINGCVALVTVPVPIVTHACAGVSVLNDRTGTGDASGNYPEGTTTVTWTAFDECGNEKSCQMTVTVGCDTTLFHCGEAVVTCYSSDRQINLHNPSGGVLGIWDVRDRSSVSPDPPMNLASSFNHFGDPDWIASNLGEIFGATTDLDFNIYVAATTIYNVNYFGADASNTGGEVHRIDAITGDISLLVRLPNTGQGLGNLTFATAQDGTRLLFVTNWENGFIYHINLDSYNGNPTDPSNFIAFDPFSQDDGLLNSYAPLGQLTWGIDYNHADNRLYFGRWMQNAGDVGSPNNCTTCGTEGVLNQGLGPNEIWSVQLTANGNFSGAAALEFCLDQIHPSSAGGPLISNPVSDISFSQSGDRMLITERSMCCPDESGAHRARVWELVNIAGACGGWSDSGKTFFLGPQGGTAGNNASGGIDYGYDDFDLTKPDSIPPCDSIAWSMCDMVWYNTYGMAGLPAQGNSSADLNTYFINVADPSGLDKRLIGDVEIFKCGCPLTSICPPECVADQINISTGYDGFAGSLLNPGDPDPLWTLVSEPSGPPALTTPQPAWVVDAFAQPPTYPVVWHDFPNSQWISAFPFNDQDQNNCSASNCSCAPYRFERCFCVCQADSVRIVFDMMSDDRAEVRLMDGSTTLDVLTNNCAAAGKQFELSNAAHVDKYFFLEQGRYCLEADLWNTNTVAMGFNLDGFIQGASVEKDICCSQVTAIVGVKFCDDDCDGVRDFDAGTYSSLEAGLPGWTIQLCDANGVLVASTVTDDQGVYVFNNVPPGTYTVKEVQQDGWTPSTPAGGSQQVTLGQNQIIDLDFGNCPPKCADLLEMEVTECDPEHPRQYDLTFILQNISDNPDFNICGALLTSETPGIEFMSCPSTDISAAQESIGLSIWPCISPGNVSAPLCAQIVTSAPLVGPTTFCFHVSVNGQDMSNGGLWEWCSQKKPFCVTLLPCCDPCTDRSVTAHAAPPPPPPAGNEGDCCHSLDIGNECETPFFTKLELAMLTGGVHFGVASTGTSGGAGWSLLGTSNLLTWTHTSGFIPSGNFPGLLNFCIEGVDDPSEIPQTVVLRWIAQATDGTDSVACTDTLTFECGLEYDCIEVLEDSIICVVDADGSVHYEYTVTLQNVSILPHEAYDLWVQQIPTQTVDFTNPIYFGSVLPPLGIITLTIPFTPLSGTALPPGTKLTFLVRLHDAEMPLPEWCCEKPDTLCIIVPPCGDGCTCGGFYLMETVGLNPNVTFDCGDTAALPCLDGLEGFWMHGDFICTNDCWQGLFFQLTHESGAVIPLPGFSASYPHWDIFIAATSLTLPGTYTLGVFQHCGDNFCLCQMSFTLDSACFDECDCEDFEADVAAGFDVSVTQCRERRLAPFSLEECDQVTWLVNNQVVGTSAGNNAFFHQFPADGVYVVCMRVERHLPDGSTCPPTQPNTKCLTLNVVCAPPYLTCDNNGVLNGGFAEYVGEGHLGYNGGVTSWDWAFWLGGDVWALDDPGCMDEGYLMFAGGSVRMAAVQQQVFIPANHDAMHVSFCYRKMQQGDLPPGTFLHLLASENSNLNIGAVTPLLSLELNPSPPGSPLDDNGWRQVDVTSVFQGTGLNYFYLTVLVDNDQPESTPPSTADLSLVGFDNLCFQTFDDPNDPLVPPIADDHNLVALSPNPVSEQSPMLTLRFVQPSKEGSILQIVDLWGRSIWRETLPPALIEHACSLAGAPPGVYFIELQENGEPVWMEKIVKQ